MAAATHPKIQAEPAGKRDRRSEPFDDSSHQAHSRLRDSPALCPTALCQFLASATICQTQEIESHIWGMVLRVYKT